MQNQRRDGRPTIRCRIRRHRGEQIGQLVRHPARIEGVRAQHCRRQPSPAVGAADQVVNEPRSVDQRRGTVMAARAGGGRWFAGVPKTIVVDQARRPAQVEPIAVVLGPIDGHVRWLGTSVRCSSVIFVLFLGIGCCCCCCRWWWWSGPLGTRAAPGPVDRLIPRSAHGCRATPLLSSAGWHWSMHAWSTKSFFFYRLVSPREQTGLRPSFPRKTPL